MIPDDQYNMFLTIWGPIWHTKKYLVNLQKFWDLGRPPPPCWEKFPNNIGFLFESVPYGPEQIQAEVCDLAWPGGGRLALLGIIINIEGKRPHRRKTS